MFPFYVSNSRFIRRLRPDGDTVGDRMPQQWFREIVIFCTPGQTAVHGIPFQQTLLIQTDPPETNLGTPRVVHTKADNKMSDRVRQSGEASAGRHIDSINPGGSTARIHIHAIGDRHVKVNLEAQPTAEALDQGDHTGLGRLV